MRNVRHFWVFLALIFGILFLFTTNDFGLVDVQHTAIITGLALDKEGEELLITADLAVPSSSTDGESTTPLQVSAKGKTVATALERIGDRLGWAPKLVYCNVLLLGEELSASDVMQPLDYFLRNEYFSDNCLLACSEGKAAELLTKKTPVDNIVSLALRKIISGEAQATGRCAGATLKDFAIGYYGETKSGYLPIVRTIQPATTAAKTENQGNAPAEEEKEIVFDVFSTALFFEGKRVEELDEKETFALNLLHEKLRSSAFPVAVEQEEYCVNLKGNSGKVDFWVENGMPKAEVRLKVRASIADKDKASPLSELSSSPILPDRVKEKVEEELKSTYESIYQKCERTNCDVFLLVEKLKRNENEYFDAYKKDLLRLTRPVYRVEVLSSRK